MTNSSGEVARLLAEIRLGREGAFADLFPLVYGELRRLAGGYLRKERAGHTLQPTACAEYPGSWSPDGAWFTFVRRGAEKHELVKVRTTGQAVPVVLRSDVARLIPSWSPTGEWIALGEELISPDGKQVRALGHGSMNYMFSADGQLVYGIRTEGARALLFSVDLASNKEKIIGDLGPEFHPGSSEAPGIRFSLAPDGRSFVFAAGRSKSNLWLLDGFNAKHGLIARLGWR